MEKNIYRYIDIHIYRYRYIERDRYISIYLYIYIKLNHFAAQQKLIQQCIKAAEGVEKREPS